MTVQLGKKVSDSVTGFSGIVTARSEYLYGCVRVLVEPEGLDANGKPIEGVWFDEQRLDSTSQAEIGGPGPVAPSRDPTR